MRLQRGTVLLAQVLQGDRIKPLDPGQRPLCLLHSPLAQRLRALVEPLAEAFGPWPVAAVLLRHPRVLGTQTPKLTGAAT